MGRHPCEVFGSEVDYFPEAKELEGFKEIRCSEISLVRALSPTFTRGNIDIIISEDYYILSSCKYGSRIKCSEKAENALKTKRAPDEKKHQLMNNMS